MYGNQCPEHVMDVLNNCNYTHFIQEPCNRESQQNYFSRYCKVSQLNCIIREYYQTPCSFPENVIQVCNILTENLLFAPCGANTGFDHPRLLIEKFESRR